MTRTVILSTNDNPDYCNYLKWCQSAWNLLGWNTLTFFFGKQQLLESTDQNRIIDITGNDLNYRVESIVQCYRLLAGHFVESGLVMTGDVDMLPMRDYWNPHPEKITAYGFDLTNYTQIPMCYVAANAARWRELFPEKNIKDLLDKFPAARSEDFETWWKVDQDAMTQRLQRHGNITHIKRGLRRGLTRGRVDRVAWDRTLNRWGRKIDAHMPRPYNEDAAVKILSMIKV